MAIQLIPTLAPAPQQASQALGQSDEQLDQIRQYIAALRAARQPVQHWAQGASNLAGDLLEGTTRGKVNDALGQRQAGTTQEYVRALNTPGSQPDETSLSTGPSGGPVARPQAAGAGVPSTAAAPMAPGGDDQLTRIAAVVNQGETGRGHNFDAQALGNISPDTHGSKSYGFMGLNSKSGSAAEFARRYGADLGLSAPPGSAEFDGQWRTASAQRPEAMRKAQMDHFRETQLQPVYADLQKLGIPTVVASDPRVLTYFADRHVQMGKLGQDNIVNAWQASGNDPVKFLHNIDQMDGTNQSLQRFFPNALAQGIYSARGHATRLATRLGGALGLGPDAGAQDAPQAAGAPAGGADPHTQAMVQALAGQQTAQAGPSPGAIGAPPSGGTLTPMQHMANFLRMGYTPQQAAQRVQEMQGMMPQYKYDDPYGREYAETPGQPRRYTGRQFGPGKEIAVPGMPFSYSETLGPNNEIIRKPNIPQFPPSGAPSTIPGAGPGPSQPSSWRNWVPQQGPPPLPTSNMPPQEQYQLLQALPAMQESYKSFMVEGGKKSAELKAINDPENQATLLKGAAEKKLAEENATERSKGIWKPIMEAQDRGGQKAQDVLQVLDRMKNAYAVVEGQGGINGGPAREAMLEIQKGINQFLPGTFDENKVAATEVARKSTAELALKQIKEASSRGGTQREFIAMLDNNPGIGLSDVGSKYMMDMLSQQARLDQRVGRLASSKEILNDPETFQDKLINFYSQPENMLISPFTGQPLTAEQAKMDAAQLKAAAASAKPPHGPEPLAPVRTKQLPPGFITMPGGP